MFEATFNPGGVSSRAACCLATLLSWSARAIFGLFAARLLFATAMFQGVPGSDHIILFWSVVGLSLFGGAVCGARSGLGYLAILPALCALAETKLIPVWNLPAIVLAAMFLGILCRSILYDRSFRTEPGPLVYAVDALSLAVLLSSLFALLHPSVANSLSVAFSVPSWPEKNEFNAMTMGFNWAAGPILFSLLASLRKSGGDDGFTYVLVRLIYFQAACIALLALPQIFTFGRSGVDVSRLALTLPFGAVHNLAGPVALFIGFFLAALIRDATARRVSAWPVIVLAMLAPLVVYASSKSLWLGIALVTGWLLWWGRLWLVLGAVTVLGVVALSVFSWSRIFPANTPVATDSVSSQFHYLVNPALWNKSPSFSERVLIWPSALTATSRFPISGIGLGAFSHMISAFGPSGFTGTQRWNVYSDPSLEGGNHALMLTYNSYHAHNDFLELAVGCGIPSLLVFIGILAVLFLLSLRKRSRTAEAAGPAFPAGVALATFLIVACFDSRLLSLPDSLLFWQFALLAASGSAVCGFGSRMGKVACAAILAPITVLIGGVWTLAAGTLPGNLTFGVWNWHWTDANGAFLLARESQFLIPPEEGLKALVFRIPEGSGLEELNIRVAMDGVEVEAGRITPESSLVVEVGNYRQPGAWTVVKTQADRWAGRGALGTPFGVKPYSTAMHKVRN